MMLQRPLPIALGVTFDGMRQRIGYIMLER